MKVLLKNPKLQILIFCIFFFIYFFIVASQTLDSDFGFHIRLGQLLVTKGIPTTDPFSYSMPSYPFIDHEWLTDISLFLGYPLLGVTGLTIIFVLLAMASFCIQYFAAKSKWAILPLVLAMGAVVNYLGIRYQVLSWLLFSVLLVFIV